jgi:hypothetical protein
MKAARPNARNDEIPGMGALIHVTEIQRAWEFLDGILMNVDKSK